MHNKAMIVDNSVAIVGGRNVADSYYAASDDYDFGDIDILAAGPIAAQVSVAFDEFWNNRLAIPIEAFVSGNRPRNTFWKPAANSTPAGPPHWLRRTPVTCAEPNPYQAAIGQLRLIWAKGNVVYDRPGKVLTSIDKIPRPTWFLRPLRQSSMRPKQTCCLFHRISYRATRAWHVAGNCAIAV